ncbi:MAG: hypothetical protein FJX46_10420 [Alphaproteobacteria bacterium]|nr:hypothetical protein [Alphaproteobacteria bacterium]
MRRRIAFLLLAIFALVVVLAPGLGFASMDADCMAPPVAQHDCEDHDALDTKTKSCADCVACLICPGVLSNDIEVSVGRLAATEPPALSVVYLGLTPEPLKPPPLA